MHIFHALIIYLPSSFHVRIEGRSEPSVRATAKCVHRAGGRGADITPPAVTDKQLKMCPLSGGRAHLTSPTHTAPAPLKAKPQRNLVRRCWCQGNEHLFGSGCETIHGNAKAPFCAPRQLRLQHRANLARVCIQ